MSASSLAPRRTSRRTYVHTAVSSLVLLIGAVLAVRHRQVLDNGTDHLVVADRGWLLLAVTAASATWLCAALIQQGAVAVPLPRTRLVAAQFAASAANHVMPAGLGATTVNWRFLTRCGLTPTATATALALKATANTLTRAVLTAALVLAGPGLIRLPHLPAATALLAPLPLVLLLPPLRRRVGPLLRGAAAEARAVHARPGRAGALWGGTIAFAASHALTVYAVAHALELPLPAAKVALAYLVASGAAVLLPTPGGLGSLDAALAFALVGVGAPGSMAVSVVLGYRLLTTWLPLVPGLVVLAVLARRKAV
ncbi:lysylphosphatidylglycerol synthase transmembrane domain-containing protein [Streptomyces sediminimaris]|uniref:lysylphosphatidylglycerol synthase transmembrane domain-containing protein n=1 Tax=Streptomyces sediminimaris TaxID=3383721 RepID=UPI003999C00D